MYVSVQLWRWNWAGAGVEGPKIVQYCIKYLAVEPEGGKLRIIFLGGKFWRYSLTAVDAKGRISKLTVLGNGFGPGQLQPRAERWETYVALLVFLPSSLFSRKEYLSLAWCLSVNGPLASSLWARYGPWIIEELVCACVGGSFKTNNFLKKNRYLPTVYHCLISHRIINDWEIMMLSSVCVICFLNIFIFVHISFYKSHFNLIYLLSVEIWKSTCRVYVLMVHVVKLEFLCSTVRNWPPWRSAELWISQ